MESPQAEVIWGDIFLNNTGLYGFLFSSFPRRFSPDLSSFVPAGFPDSPFLSGKGIFSTAFLLYNMHFCTISELHEANIFFLHQVPVSLQTIPHIFLVLYPCSFLLFFFIVLFIVLSDFFLFSFSFHSAFRTGSLPFSLPSICPSIFCQPCDILKLHSDVPR